jgi:hypothetical protein
MLVTVHVVDTQPGVSVLSRKWEFDVPKITLRELLRERVRRDVEAFNRRRPEVYRGLVQPEDSERVDAGREYEHALKAFESNGFLVFAAGRQIDSLDEEIDLESAGEVEFLKLIPLVAI